MLSPWEHVIVYYYLDSFLFQHNFIILFFQLYC